MRSEWKEKEFRRPALCLPAMRVSRQVVLQFDPGKLLRVMNVELRNNIRRVFQARRMEMDFVRIGVGVIGDRRPAIGAEQPAHAR